MTSISNGDAMSVWLVSAPLHATFFSLATDGSFTFTPEANYFTPPGVPVTFQYRAFDGWLYGNIVTVSLTITPQPDAPVAADDAVRTPVDTPIAIDVLANDTDVDLQTLWLASVSINPGEPWDGTATRNTNRTPADRSDDYIDYSPGMGFVGTNSFEYQDV